VFRIVDWKSLLQITQLLLAKCDGMRTNSTDNT